MYEKYLQMMILLVYRLLTVLSPGRTIHTDYEIQTHDLKMSINKKF